MSNPYNIDDYKKRGYTVDFLHIPSGKTVSFRAIITAFSDDYKSAWRSEPVYGRMDPVENFQNTTRTISFSWKTVSVDDKDAIKNQEDASRLISMLYPTYNGDGRSSLTISTSPVLKLRLSNLVMNTAGGVATTGPIPARYVGAGLVGRSAGFTYEPDQDEGFFDFPDNRLIPKTVKFSCQYTVYHTHPLGWSPGGKFLAPKFPYGVQSTGGEERNPKEGAGSSGTKEHREAKESQILSDPFAGAKATAKGFVR